MSDITVQPRKFSGTVDCPPDKSITHRAIMLGGVALDRTVIRRPLLGDDCLSTADCMRRIGANIQITDSVITVDGARGLRSAALYAGNSGTTMRLLCGLLAGREGEWTIGGDESLSRRPMDRVINPLAAMGADIRSDGGRAPLRIYGSCLHAIDYAMPIDSAQVKSAVILAAFGAQGKSVITEREYTRDHTEIMLGAMGANICRDGKSISVVGGGVLHGLDLTVAGDISGAAFPLVAGLITGGRVTVRGVGLNPTRTGLIDVLREIGADMSIEDERTVCGETVGDVSVRGLGAGRPFRITHDIIPRLVDEIPVLCVLACFIEGDSVIEGAEELRVKESDRIAATVRLIRDFGGIAEETADGLIIRGKGYLEGGCTYDPAGDHRMAMSAAVAAMASKRGATVKGAECVSVSYPDFWQMTESLR